jgi:hypothetical protein
MKIQNKSKMIISLSLFIAVTFFLASHLQEKKEPVVFKRPLSAKVQQNVNSMTVDETADLYCGILLMPKSMVPALEQFTQSKLAKDINILPAKIEWNNGYMTAVPQETILVSDNSQTDPPTGKDIQLKSWQTENFTDKENKKLNAALLYYFLANASKNQIQY